MTEWILDSGCSYHMCPYRDWFTNYQSIDGGKVLMGNNAACKVVGIGAIKIKMFDGIVRTLLDVKHVPELKKNLISLGTLDSNGCTYKAGGGVMRISKGALVVMKGLKHNGLYFFKIVQLQVLQLCHPQIQIRKLPSYGICDLAI